MGGGEYIGGGGLIGEVEGDAYQDEGSAYRGAGVVTPG